ncbi:MAG: class I SAM-dependent RNA methyltransferase [Verrucomicrobia bacterium]|nr:class I SAM-dependent RNA methyltransferase [Verrucomicrobiota bacterium]
MCLVGFVGKKKFNDQPFAYHTEIELEIATLTNLGVGLGRVPLPGALSLATSPLSLPPPAAGGGWVVMVPFTLPGERVRARVFRNHKNFSEADLVSVLTPSPHRVAPACPLFARCGGCQYQHLAYTEQLAWKRRQVAELLQHMAGIADFPVAPVVASPQQLGYRSKITPHFNPPRDPAVAPPIGFLRQGTRFDIVDVPRCPIATDAINERLASVRADIHARAATGEFKRGATLLLRDASGVVTTDYDAVITETIEVGSALRADLSFSKLPANPGPLGERALPSQPLRLHFLARDFFQNNPFILPAFTGYVRAQAAASGARFLVDAYCGSGLFALSAASAFERVAGVEISESSVRFAGENAAANGITNATFLAADAAQIFAGLPAHAPAFAPADTVVVIDPPRKGCDENFLRQLFAFGPRAVVYVSCDPATQMRDLRHFLTAGYTLTAAQPFDLFPQTRHLECVLTLRR